MRFSITTYNKFIVVYTALLIQLELIGGFLGFTVSIMLMFVILFSLSAFSVGHDKTYFNQFKTAPIQKILFCLGGIFLLGITSILWSRAPLYGITKMVIFFTQIFTAVLVAPIISNHRELFLKSSVIITFFILILVVIKYNNPVQIAIESDLYNRLGDHQGGNINPIWIGRYFGMVSLVLLVNAFHIKRFYPLALNSLLLILTVSYAILTGSKGAVLFLIVLSVMILLSSMGNPKQLFRLVFPFIIISGLFLLNDNIRNSISNFISSDFFQYRFIAYDYSSSSDRTELYKIAIIAINDVAKTTPLFFFIGRGIGDFGFYILNFDAPGYPHNIFLETLYEIGLFGFILLVWMPIIFLKKLWEKRRELNSYEGLFGVLGLYFLLNSFVSGDLSANASAFIFIIIYFFCFKHRKTSGLYLSPETGRQLDEIKI